MTKHSNKTTSREISFPHPLTAAVLDPTASHQSSCLVFLLVMMVVMMVVVVISGDVRGQDSQESHDGRVPAPSMSLSPSRGYKVQHV